MEPSTFPADQKTFFSCGAQNIFQLIRKLPYVMEPNAFSADQKTFLSYGPKHFSYKFTVTRLIRKLPSLVEPNTSFS